VRTIECFFDCSSPWTYLCFHNLQPLAAECGATIRWRPILVGGVFNAVNPSVYAAREQPVPAKAAWMTKSLADWADLAGIDIVFPPPVFPVNSVKAMRACLVLLEEPARMVDFARRVFEAYWARGEDISRDDVLATILAGCRLDAQTVMSASAAAPIRQQLRDNVDELIARGGFGSPTMFVDGDDMYFGNDALPLVRRALRRRRQA
jgi:2-hydroxychromene-2-carboxylate isomerase